MTRLKRTANASGPWLAAAVGAGALGWAISGTFFWLYQNTERLGFGIQDSIGDTLASRLFYVLHLQDWLAVGVVAAIVAVPVIFLLRRIQPAWLLPLLWVSALFAAFLYARTLPYGRFCCDIYGGITSGDGGRYIRWPMLALGLQTLAAAAWLVARVCRPRGGTTYRNGTGWAIAASMAAAGSALVVVGATWLKL